MTTYNIYNKPLKSIIYYYTQLKQSEKDHYYLVEHTNFFTCYEGLQVDIASF